MSKGKEERKKKSIKESHVENEKRDMSMEAPHKHLKPDAKKK